MDHVHVSKHASMVVTSMVSVYLLRGVKMAISQTVHATVRKIVKRDAMKQVPASVPLQKARPLPAKCVMKPEKLAVLPIV